MKYYLVGLDVGSTTVKIAVLDILGNIIYKQYMRHYSDIRKTVAEIIKNCSEVINDVFIKICITGSGAIDVSKYLEITFVQEVAASTMAIEKFIPNTDVVIELGGEDAKITYLSNNLEQRMNGSCAGGTGAFIDQMAVLMKTDATGLNELSKNHKTIYTIASRCGVFAKTDVQPLLNEGARKEDVAASIFQAVVNQTISGLAQGRPITGNIAFLGGPLYFLSELRNRFKETLDLNDENFICPEDANYYVAIGAALLAKDNETINFNEFYNKTKNLAQNDNVFRKRDLDPLFNDEDEYREFLNRHNENKAKTKNIAEYFGKAYLGIDAGSTTTKLVLITEDGEILYSYYASNEGNPLHSAVKAVKELYSKLHNGIKIAYTTVTGYGENLIKTALSIDSGEIETIAHYKAADFFLNGVDFIIDIGGQDMKSMIIKDGIIDSIMLNEACSSGCGSFIETFAISLGMSVTDFANEAIFSSHPVDLGTRCTVFMNSKVKQAQREGATLSDISAGISFSVIKNALFKVIRLKSIDEIGDKIVVQGGTFYNNAVLRAFEKVIGREVIRPDIAGIMGAFGAALVAKSKYTENYQSSFVSEEELDSFSFNTSMDRCGLCTNNCLLTVNQFSDGRYFVSGNRCERGAEKYTQVEKAKELPNLYRYKYKRVFSYKPLPLAEAKRGIIGIPRVLNMYEDYPFWFTFFTTLGYRVVLSGTSNKKIYELGMGTIPSESVCYPGKITHGHIVDLMNKKVEKIFYPCISYNIREDENSGNHYNCPVVVSYPESIEANIDLSSIKFYKPFLNLNDEKRVVEKLFREIGAKENLTFEEIQDAVKKSYDELLKYKADVKEEGKRAIEYVNKNNLKAILLAGRPYHIDPEINHGIPEMIEAYGLAVLSEDCLESKYHIERPLRVIDQWAYHTRLYAAATFVANSDNLELVQLNSFGCGLDAVTTDQVQEILKRNNKIYTLIKIDEITNLGAIRIRIRSLLASMEQRNKNNIAHKRIISRNDRVLFTKKMKKKHTILIPQMSPMHFQFIEIAAKMSGYNAVLLTKADKKDIDTGLRVVNNDACYPSIIVIGQLIGALQSGKYDLNNISLLISQTGGGCRATNYIGFIRKALRDLGYEKIPVISFNLRGLEKQPGFKITASFVNRLVMGLVIGDTLMRAVYRTRPYERNKGEVNSLYNKWVKKSEVVVKSGNLILYTNLINSIVKDFDNVELDESKKKPKVGIVGEILVKFHPDANNDVFSLLEEEGAEVVVPDLLDFFSYSAFNGVVKYDELLMGSKKTRAANKIAYKAIELYKRPSVEAFKKSMRFTTPSYIEEIAHKASKFLSLSNQSGEGWFLTGEMIELIDSGVNNIICLQPFACLPNHITGKGMIKKLKDAYPMSNIVPIDYDAGASEVNQINRIKLMLTNAIRNMKKEQKSVITLGDVLEQKQYSELYVINDKQAQEI